MRNLIDLERAVLQFRVKDVNELNNLKKEAMKCEFCHFHFNWLIMKLSTESVTSKIKNLVPKNQSDLTDGSN